jgi:AdoMet dependent proline di-methyltransferase
MSAKNERTKTTRRETRSKNHAMPNHHHAKKSKRRSSPSTATAATTTTEEQKSAQHSSSSSMMRIPPSAIKGSDDLGNYYNSQTELAAHQQMNRSAWYQVNADWWITGYGGCTDDEAMIGDEGGLRDADEGLAFLDRLLLLSMRPNSSSSSTSAASTSSGSAPTGTTKLLRRGCCCAMDVGAGVGRITKHILLKRYETVQLVEGDTGWSKRSRVYLGKKRAGRCTFICRRLEDITPDDCQRWTAATTTTEGTTGGGGGGGGGADLIWLQWTLQYLTDQDAVSLLTNLAAGLTTAAGPPQHQQQHTTTTGGIMIVKENRPYGQARSDRFQMDTPAGSGRYDITRTDTHHRWLLQQAGLTIVLTEQGDETNTYAVVVANTKK